MSGKRSRKIRAAKHLSKKAIAGAAAAIHCAAPVATEGGEFLVSLYPSFSFPIVKFDNSLSTGFGGGLRVTYKPTEYFNIFIQGDYKQYSFDTKQGIGDVSVLEGKLGAGYYLPLGDRLGLNFDAGVGYYNTKYQKGSGSTKSSTDVNGFSVSGGVSLSYKIGPVVSVSAGVGVNHLAYKDSNMITSLDVTPGITINLTKAFSSKSAVTVEQKSLKPVFPVFYSWYNDNSFGSIEVRNGEDASITDVNVYFYQPQYMSQPQNCGSTSVLKKGESIDVDLCAFFNEQMLNLNEKTDTLTSIIVEYKYLGAKRSATFPMVVPVYGRNNMSWEDDRCASAFVSSKDPAAMWFAKYVVSTIRDNVRSGVPQNIQYAMGIFEALDQFGINYVKDPTSAFEDNVGTASIDFLQFPYQTLMYRGGDCDDLSILVCSLLESIGIKTAFITIPGHIYMAFDSGFTLEQAQNYFLTLDEFIIDGDKVWVPLEITLSDEGFNKAWHKGAWEWNTASRSGTAMLYKMEDSWKTYKPVNVPGAAAKFTLPEETYVARLFSHSVDEFVLNQITPQIAWYENRIAAVPSAQNYNDFGVLYARYGLFEQAEQQFRIARNKNYLPAVLNTANLYYSIKDYERATNWYNEVLKTDKNNSLAQLGLARCAYETGDYAECDHWYGSVYENDYALARQYSYLGAFEQTGGRSFSLADRLENTIWLQSVEYNLRDGTTPVVPGKQSNVQTQVVMQTTDTIPPLPVSDLSGDSVVAVVPASVSPEGEGEKEKEELEEEPVATGGDKDPEEEVVVQEEVIAQEETVTQKEVPVHEEVPAQEEVPIQEEEPVAEIPYTGIASELDFNILSAADLAALAEEAIIENGETLDDFDITEASLSVLEDKLIEEIVEEPEPQTQGQAQAQDETQTAGESDNEELAPLPDSATTSILTDVPVRAVPRFTEQPSEKWAPKEAYTVETIPGMRSFEEEMGNYANEKAFLYKEEYDFSVNPGEEIKQNEKQEENSLAVLEVNPFASFLPKEDVAKMESITNFKVDTSEALAKAEITEAEPEPVVVEPVIVAAPEPVEGPELPEPVEGVNGSDGATTKKSHKTLFAVLAGVIAAAFAALAIGKKKRKEK